MDIAFFADVDVHLFYSKVASIHVAYSCLSYSIFFRFQYSPCKLHYQREYIYFLRMSGYNTQRILQLLKPLNIDNFSKTLNYTNMTT